MKANLAVEIDVNLSYIARRSRFHCRLLQLVEDFQSAHTEVFATMHALRLHKGRVPGRDKARKARKSQQVTRQRDARGSILQGLRSFLTVDSFMYGPLMESPPIVTIQSDDSEPQTPDREQENGGFDDDTSWDYESREENDTSSGKNTDDENVIRRHQGSRSNSKTVVSVQRTSARMTARTMLPLANGSCTPSSTARVPKPSRNGTCGTF